MIDDLSADCPECGGALRFSLDDVARQCTVRCLRGHDVRLQDEGGGAAQASKSLRDLDRSLERLNRTFNM